MRRRARGATLVEILISLAIVLIGMLALFRTLAVSVAGAGTSSHISQAQLRAAAILESIRSAPKSALDCLTINTPPSWGACETTCLNAYPTSTTPTVTPQACIFTTASVAQLKGPMTSTTGTAAAGQLPSTDRSGQQYAVVYFSTPEVAPDGSTRTSFVEKTGPGNAVYDVQVSIGWRDDGTTAVSDPAVSGDHFVTLRSAVAAF
jgi:Tfp pilus assembly protein PilV